MNVNFGSFKITKLLTITFAFGKFKQSSGPTVIKWNFIYDRVKGNW